MSKSLIFQKHKWCIVHILSSKYTLEERDNSEEINVKVSGVWRWFFNTTGCAHFLASPADQCDLSKKQNKKTIGYLKKNVQGKMTWTYFLSEFIP